MSFISNLEQSAVHLGEFLSGEFGQLVKELEPIAKSAATGVLAQLLPDAVKIVTDIASGQLDSSAKKEAAVAALGAKAESLGLAAGGSVLSAAVELGLQVAAAQSPAVAATLSQPAASGAASAAAGSSAPAGAAS
jgi:hypothetical protein